MKIVTVEKYYNAGPDATWPCTYLCRRPLWWARLWKMEVSDV
jgi:hypothetical protein